MNHQRIILESSPGFVLVCILLGLGYGFLLYRKTYPWSKRLNWVLFSLRSILAFFLSFLLLGPIVRQVNNLFEKPLFIVLRDDSGSIKEAVDSTTLTNAANVTRDLQQTLTEKQYDVVVNDLEGEDVGPTMNYTAASSDLQGALKKLSSRYEGRRLGGVILVSDGIYNSGLSPLYSTYNFPIYTIGVGDTSQRVDIAIKNVAYNKIAYQGNKFPIRVEILLKGLENQDLNVTLAHKGKVIDKQRKSTGKESLVVYDFQPLAEEQGIQKFDLQVDVHPEEFNRRNNHVTIFVEVVEGKKKILLVAPSPHPDIKALRTVIEKNSNYEFLLHMPGVKELEQSALQPGNVDLAIFLQAPDLRNKTTALFQQFLKSNTSMLITLGRQTDYAFLSRQNIPLKVEPSVHEFDEVTPVINPAFNNFVVESETGTIFSGYPPVIVPFSKTQFSLNATPLLFQRIGSIVTDKPLMAVNAQDSRKIAVLLGEGIWRWRLDEFDREENAEAFDELFGKLIQYLSTSDEKKKFRSYPIEQEFSEVEPVTFESQVYNDIFEPVYGNSIDIELTNDEGKKTQYTYVTSPGNIRYQIGDLKEGVYQYRASTKINGKNEEVHGQFAVVAKMAELQNLTADFDLLRKLSANTGGEFYRLSQASALNEKLARTEAQSIIRTEETYDSLINIKWIFWILLTMISLEWFLRKYFGDY